MEFWGNENKNYVLIWVESKIKIKMKPCFSILNFDELGKWFVYRAETGTSKPFNYFNLESALSDWTYFRMSLWFNRLWCQGFVDFRLKSLARAYGPEIGPNALFILWTVQSLNLGILVQSKRSLSMPETRVRIYTIFFDMVPRRDSFWKI